MNVTYTLQNGEKLSLFLWTDLYNDRSSSFRKEIEVSSTFIPKKTLIMEVNSEDGRKFILWRGQRVYLSDFDYLTISEIKGKMSNDEFVSCDDFLTAFIKDTANVNLLFVVDNLIYKPRESKWRSKKDWGYRLELVAKNENSNFPKVREYYFSDLLKLIREGVYVFV